MAPMGIAERKERQKTEMRERILEAASAIVLAEGFGALTMRKIAERIEYSPATIYLHFASRDDIARHLVRAGFREVLRYFTPAIGIADPCERLRALARAYCAFGREHPGTYRLVFMERYSSEIFAPDPAVGDTADAGAFAILTDTIVALHAAMGSGAPSPEEAHRSAQLVWAALHGIVSLAITCSEFLGPDTAPIEEQMLDVLIRGLGA
jgi:AcrR family transcriptional regulator